jgi:tRNA pseudouridine38-40 synthase
MVRRIVGVLVEIGRGGLPPDAIATFLAPGSASAQPNVSELRRDTSAPARLTAPPSGLFLERVFYKDDPRDPPLHHGVFASGFSGSRAPSTKRTTSA